MNETTVVEASTKRRGGWNCERKEKLPIGFRPDQAARLRVAAEARGVSVGHLVRESVDRLLAEVPTR